MLVRSKLEYASEVQNLLTSTNANKLECIQQKFVSVCFYRFSFIFLLSYVGDFSTLGVSPSNDYCPARCVYAASVVGKDLNMFAIGAISFSHVL
jgi:hypothetical protein